MPTFEGLPITLDNVPPEARRPVSITVTEQEFKSRLKDGGTMELIDTTWRIGDSPDFSSNRSAFLALDRLVLKNSTIITNGNVFTLFINKLISNGGRIVSFAAEHRKARNGSDASNAGAPGQPGEPGDSGGPVSIHIIQDLEGTLEFDLSGQDAGNGGIGAKGSKGVQGSRGANAVSDIVNCRSGGQDGGQGNLGLPGGNGGDGGAGGQGGSLFLFQINKEVGEGLYRFVSNGGKGGEAGGPGVGGNGGDGGEGGSGSGPCGGGHGGPIGNSGPSGAPGNSGRTAGSGQIVAKSINMEVAIRIAATGATISLPT